MYGHVRSDEAQDCAEWEAYPASEVRMQDWGRKREVLILDSSSRILYGDGGPSSNPNHEPPEPSPTEATYGKATESKQVIRAAEARFINGELARAISGRTLSPFPPEEGADQVL